MALRKCTGCLDKSRYDPETMLNLPGGWFHSINCATEHGQRKAKAAREKAVKKQASKQKEADREFKRETKRRKVAAKSKSDWAKEAQREFNRFIRLRDAKQPCISCQRHHQGQYHAGHYKTVGAHPELRFNEDNCFKQCAPCNNHLSGNITNYRPNLIELIGQNRVDALDYHSGGHFIGPPSPFILKGVELCQHIKATYKQKANELV